MLSRAHSTYSTNDPFPYTTAPASASSSIAAMYDQSCYNPGGPDYQHQQSHYRNHRGGGGHGHGSGSGSGHFAEPSFPPTGYESGYTEYDGQYGGGGSERVNYYHQHESQAVSRIVDQRSAELISNFMRAACSNCIKMITDMIRDDVVSPNAQDQSHMTAIMYASLNGHMNVVRKLIEYGAQVAYTHPFNENTALHLAAQCGHTRTVELLLKSGQLRPNRENRDGKTAYQLARDFGHGQNKVMKRLFKEYGGYVEYSGGARGGGGLRMMKNVADDDDNEESSSESGGSSSVVDSQLDEVKNESSNKLTIAQPPESVSDLKQSSMLPNYELLVRFSQIGLYRPLASGKGFAFLAPHGTTVEMVKYARIALQVGDSDKELKAKLKAILHDFEEDPLLKAQVKFEAQHPEKVMRSADAQQQKDHPIKRNLHNRRGAAAPNSRQDQSESCTMALDPEIEQQNYLRWKKVNMNKIQEMIDSIL